jgi:hypothetical protein
MSSIAAGQGGSDGLPGSPSLNWQRRALGSARGLNEVGECNRAEWRWFIATTAFHHDTKGIGCPCAAWPVMARNGSSGINQGHQGSLRAITPSSWARTGERATSAAGRSRHKPQGWILVLNPQPT